MMVIFKSAASSLHNTVHDNSTLPLLCCLSPAVRFALGLKAVDSSVVVSPHTHRDPAPCSTHTHTGSSFIFVPIGLKYSTVQGGRRVFRLVQQERKGKEKRKQQKKKKALTRRGPRMNPSSLLVGLTVATPLRYTNYCTGTQYMLRVQYLRLVERNGLFFSFTVPGIRPSSSITTANGLDEFPRNAVRASFRFG